MKKLLYLMIALGLAQGMQASSESKKSGESLKTRLILDEDEFPQLTTLKEELRTISFYSPYIEGEAALIAKALAQGKDVTARKENLESVIKELQKLIKQDILSKDQTKHLQDAIDTAKEKLSGKKISS